MTWGFIGFRIAGARFPCVYVIPSLWTAKSSVVDSLVRRR